MAHGHETATEIIGTGGRLTVGRDGRGSTSVEISDAHGVRNEMHADVLRALRRRVPARGDAFRRLRALDNRAPALTLHDATEATRIGIALRTSLEERRVVDL